MHSQSWSPRDPLSAVTIEHTDYPDISETSTVLATDTLTSWSTPIREFLEERSPALTPEEILLLQKRATRYVIINGQLYKKSFSMPLLEPKEADYVLQEIHQGVCGNHMGGMALAQNVVRQPHGGHGISSK